MSLIAANTGPDFLEKGIAQTVTITIEDGGQIKVPTVGTYTLLDSTGTAVSGLDGVSATSLAGGLVTYDLGTGALSSEAFSDEYKSVWSLTIDGVVKPFDVEALIVRRKPRSPLSLTSLRKRMSELEGDYNLPDGKTSWQDYIDTAFDDTVARLMAAGVSVHEITSWYGTLAYVYRVTLMGVSMDLMSTRSGASKWLTLWEVMGGPVEDPRSAEFAWTTLTRFRMDRDQDGIPDVDGASEGKPGSFVESANEAEWRGF